MHSQRALVFAMGAILFCLTLLYMGHAPGEPADATSLMAISHMPAAQEQHAPTGASPPPEQPRPGPKHISAVRGLQPASPADPTQANTPAPTPPRQTLHTPPAAETSRAAASRTVTALVTGYCPCKRCCGRFANGRTATRTSAWDPGIAADPSVIPYGSRIEVPGYGRAAVDDTGIAMRRSWRYRGRVHLDVRFDYHYEARRWGARLLKVRITPPPGETLGF